MQPNFQSKILELDALLAAVRTAREKGQVVVQCHGCFDIVHPGHVRYLEFAKRQGDVLVVSLTGDVAMSKGPQRPYIPEELRAENLAALESVDFVDVNPDPTAEEIFGQLWADLYVKGREYENSTDPGFLAEKRIVEEYGGRITFSSGEIVFSSTKLIEMLPEEGELESYRLMLVCRRYGITREQIEATLDRFRDLHVLIVGDVVLDRYAFCDPIGVASESPMMSLAQIDERRYVGGAAIVARHVTALGAHAFLLSSGGTDPVSSEVKETLEREGVEVRLLETRPTIVEKTRFLAGDTKLFKVDRASHCPLDSVAERHAALILEQQAKIADAVIFSDFGYGTITGGLLARTLPTLRQNVGTIAADVSGGRANLLNFHNVDLLCPTEREVRAALNDYDSGLSSVAWDLLDKTQARHVLVTLEKRGMVVFERPSQDRSSPEWSGRLKSESLPSFADRVTDRLGCGDALLAAATLALAAGDGDNLLQAAYLGNAAAAIEIAAVGNVPVTVEAMREWLRTRREFRTTESKPSTKSAKSLERNHSSDPAALESSERRRLQRQAADPTSASSS